MLRVQRGSVAQLRPLLHMHSSYFVGVMVGFFNWKRNKILDGFLTSFYATNPLITYQVFFLFPYITTSYFGNQYLKSCTLDTIHILLCVLHLDTLPFLYVVNVFFPFLICHYLYTVTKEH